VAGACKYGDEPAGSGTMELVNRRPANKTDRNQVGKKTPQLVA
jgi:hypothetical protein